MEDTTQPAVEAKPKRSVLPAIIITFLFTSLLACITSSVGFFYFYNQGKNDAANQNNTNTPTPTLTTTVANTSTPTVTTTPSPTPTETPIALPKTCISATNGIGFRIPADWSCTVSPLPADQLGIRVKSNDKFKIDMGLSNLGRGGPCDFGSCTTSVFYQNSNIKLTKYTEPDGSLSEIFGMFDDNLGLNIDLGSTYLSVSYTIAPDAQEMKVIKAVVDSIK